MYEIAVIGGGVIGTAILDKLTRKGVKAILLEKGDDVSLGASRANSGIIHAGHDCKPGTLKARFNVEGNAMYDKLAEELGIPFKRIGAFVLGDDKEKIDEMYNRGLANGVQELKVMDRAELLTYIPNLAEGMNYGLFAKRSGIISPYMLTIAFAEEAVLNGNEVLFNYEVVKIEKQNGIFKIFAKDNRTVEAKVVVNATASAFNEISKMMNTETYDIHFRRGEYNLLDSTQFGLVDRKSVV